MSDRNYTYIREVVGPNAIAAEQAAITALRDLSKDEGGWDSYHGAWDDDKKEYFDHNSGQGAVVTVALASQQFPSETFHLFVNGGMAENYQGPVLITCAKASRGNGSVGAYGATARNRTDLSEPLLSTPLFP